MDISDLISSIIGGILGLLIIAVFIIGFIYCIKYDNIKGKREHQYLKSLDKHDRQVIYNYWVASKVRFVEVFSKEENDNERHTKPKD